MDLEWAASGWVTRDDIIDSIVNARVFALVENPDWEGRQDRLFRCAVGEKRVCAEEGVNRGSDESAMSSNGFCGPDDDDADHRSGQRFGYPSFRGTPSRLQSLFLENGEVERGGARPFSNPVRGLDEQKND